MIFLIEKKEEEKRETKKQNTEKAKKKKKKVSKNFNNSNLSLSLSQIKNGEGARKRNWKKKSLAILFYFNEGENAHEKSSRDSHQSRAVKKSLASNKSSLRKTTRRSGVDQEKTMEIEHPEGGIEGSNEKAGFLVSVVCALFFSFVMTEFVASRISADLQHRRMMVMIFGSWIWMVTLWTLDFNLLLILLSTGCFLYRWRRA